MGTQGGRFVFRGNDVRDQNWEHAIFQELGSSPAAMKAGKSADLYGLLPGHSIEQSDAEQAYTQTLLGGTETWVTEGLEIAHLSVASCALWAPGCGGLLGETLRGTC